MAKTWRFTQGSTHDVRLTANARAMGSVQTESVNTNGNPFRLSNQTWAATGGGIGSAQIYAGVSNSSYGSGATYLGGRETRPMNTAYHPRIHA